MPHGLGCRDLWTPLDWAAETCRDPRTGLRRPMDTFGLGHGDLWTWHRKHENKCYQNIICCFVFTEVRWIFIVCIGGRMDLWRPMDWVADGTAQEGGVQKALRRLAEGYTAGDRGVKWYGGGCRGAQRGAWRIGCP